MRICHQLDGLPLALCRPAGGVGTLNVSEVTEELTAKPKSSAPCTNTQIR